MDARAGAPIPRPCAAVAVMCEEGATAGNTTLYNTTHQPPGVQGAVYIQLYSKKTVQYRFKIEVS